MGEIPEGFEPYVDGDGDQLWLDTDGATRSVGPGLLARPGPGWRQFYVGPPLPNLRSLEDGTLPDPGRSNAWRDAADDLRGLLDVDDQ